MKEWQVDIMKLKKQAAALIAAVTAAVPLSANGLLSAHLSVHAEEETKEVALPNWVPLDFDSALEFRNTYGTTRVDDGIVCFVFTESSADVELPKDASERYKVIEGTNINHFDITMLEPQIVTKKQFQARFTSDTEEGHYSDLQFEVVVYSPRSSGDFMVFLDDATMWGVNCYTPEYTFRVDEDFNITETDIYGWLPDCAAEYEDFVEKNGEIAVVNGNYVAVSFSQASGIPYDWKETTDHSYGKGEFAVIGTSDCSPMYNVPVGGGRCNSIALYRADSDGLANISWSFVQFGDTEKPAKQLSSNFIITGGGKNVAVDTDETDLKPGQTRIYVLDRDTGKPVSDDILKAYPFTFGTYIAVQTPTGEAYTGPFNVVNKNGIVIDTDLASLYRTATRFEFLCNDKPVVKTYSNGSMELTFTTKIEASGDSNGDGIFGISDAVSLYSWLMRMENAHIDEKASDLCMDGKIDVYDFVLMRKKLVENMPEFEAHGEPVLVVEYGSGGFQDVQDLIIYDSNGIAYHTYNNGGKTLYGFYDFGHFENDDTIVKFNSGSDWYSRLEDILSRPYARYDSFYLNTAALESAKEISAKAEEYSKAERLPSETRWLDGTTMSIYAVSKDSSGNSHCAKLAQLLANYDCIDDDDIIGFVDELCRSNFVNYSGLEADFESYLKRQGKALQE